MKKTAWIWQLFGFAITALCGTLLHFLYDFTNKSVWAAPFSGVNESTWEHMKLLFWPMFIFAVIQSFFFKDNKSFRCIKLRGMLLGLGSIPIIFYTYNGAIGKSPDRINIAIFFISAAIAYVYESRQLNSDGIRCKSPRMPFFIIFIILILFVLFTFITPKIPIFRDPSGAYGI